MYIPSLLIPQACTKEHACAGGGGDKSASIPACKSKAPPTCTHHRMKEPQAMAEGGAGKKSAR